MRLFFDTEGNVLSWVVGPHSDIQTHPDLQHIDVPDDTDPAGVRVVDGDLVSVANDDNAAWIKMRARRDMLLAACDWTQLPDTACDREAWALYRAELRDLPQNTVDPENVTWPDKPE